MISSSTKPPLTTPPSKRIAEAMDFEIKCWAAGKEGNMRALHHHCNRYFGLNVVGSHFHLTDLITSGSVKRVYRKATLCVHPDNVQQKGATIEQKYITEKVFDILKKGNQQGNWGIDNMHYLNYGLWKNEFSSFSYRLLILYNVLLLSDSPKEQLSVHGSDG
ncbi:hypothetical protein CRYUN_Cryun05aG0061800 [Craigia yunnanensis]